MSAIFPFSCFTLVSLYICKRIGSYLNTNKIEDKHFFKSKKANEYDLLLKSTDLRIMKTVSEPRGVVHGSAFNPSPKWNNDRLVSVLRNLNVSNKTTTSPTRRGFVMRVSEYDDDDDDSHETEMIARYNESRKEADRKIRLYYQRTESAQQDQAKLVLEAARVVSEMQADIDAAQAKKEVEDKVVMERVSVAARSTLALERRRMNNLEYLQVLKEFLTTDPVHDFTLFEENIATVVKNIEGSNVTAQLNELVKTFEDPDCPEAISVAAFAKAAVSGSCRDPFACSYAIVYVTSRFLLDMDAVLAEFHKACSYTVPRSDANSESAWDFEAYRRLDAVMRLYGALVQTEVPGDINSHGIEHGLTWLARFFKNIPANDRASATALHAFLQTAGYGLHHKYKSQFLKVADAVRDYLAKLRAKKDLSDLQMLITQITFYLDYRVYLKEPRGRTLLTNLVDGE